MLLTDLDDISISSKDRDFFSEEKQIDFVHKNNDDQGMVNSAILSDPNFKFLTD